MAMPLRVIDLKGTIENSEAGGIHFARSETWHVISHTWSSEVRAFSSIIGERQKLNGEQGYESLFEAAGFHSHPAYQKLIEFLIILETEEVRWVWFDAVCINQADGKEKDREIQHMGGYYQNCVGCYVLQHGIGKGFELLLNNGESDDASPCGNGDSHLPRWFTRAWTLQEWVLSPWLTFILDLASEQCLRTIASIILRHAPRDCLCCRFDTTISPFFLRRWLLEHADLHATHENERCQKDSDLCSNAVMACMKSGCFCAAQGPHFRKVPGRSHWYFVDDLGYSFLLRVKFHMRKIPDDWDGKDFHWEHMDKMDFNVTNRIGVKQSIIKRQKQVVDLPLVITEISERDCSNAEDRVLSVLKLLGVQNAVQVRTGKSLHAQLLHLAECLGDMSSAVQDQLMLIRLCLVDGFGSAIPGMSWMPEFEIQEGSWQEGARSLAANFYSHMGYLDGFEPEMRCEISNMGMLQIEGDVCMGQFSLSDEMFRKPHDQFRRADEVSRSMVVQVGGQVIMYVFAHMFTTLAQRKTCILQKVGSLYQPFGDNGMELHVAFEADGLHCLPRDISVWLVKVGVLHSLRMRFWLVCIGKGNESPLHKIGYLRTSMDRSDSPLAGSRRIQCSIGGLGGGSDELLYGSGIENALEPNSPMYV